MFNQVHLADYFHLISNGFLEHAQYSNRVYSQTVLKGWMHIFNSNSPITVDFHPAAPSLSPLQFELSKVRGKSTNRAHAGHGAASILLISEVPIP